MTNPWDRLPEKFREKLPLFLSSEQEKQVLEAFTHRNPPTFRANTLKITADTLQEELQKEGIEVQRVPWYTDAFILMNVPQRILTQTKWYTEGYLYVQSLSSIIPPLVLNPQQHDKVLDLCAAPGSKTTQIAALLGNTGEILANDKSHVRNFRLKANLMQQGVTNVQVTQWPGEIMWKNFPNVFNCSLVDVPCSMEGRFYTEDPKSYQDWTPAKVNILQEKQKFLLRSAIGSTRIGGTIIYSTCTLSPEENEMVIDWILKKEKDAIILEDAHIPDLSTTPALLTYKHRTFDPQLKNAFRILPSKDMEGFFVAKIRKLKATTPTN